ncbi:MAG: mannonate dehydratase [Anaerolineae bacterium]|nr:mannonate dehydratase [Anaerolineae bacterium]
MKLGLGLYRSMLTRENFQFARQAGATHLVVHLVDYFRDADSLSTSSGGDTWGITRNQDKLWTYEELRDLKAAINDAGLEWEAIENFDPSHWHDILLDGPRKAEQMENVKTIIRNIGKAGIPIMGYNFSIAGVWGRTPTLARGGASSVGFIEADAPPQAPIPNGTVWNMIYDPDAAPGDIGTITSEQLWQRLTDFLEEIIPVAEEAGVRMAAHPDDPPLPTVRNTARLVYQPDMYQRLLDIVPSDNNMLEFCLGSLAEMTEGDVHEATERYSSQGKLAYIHFRNVRGKVPNYHEVFVDEGDIDMYRILRTLRDNHFDGVLIPDHTPQMTCDAPWHAGMAYAMGWMRAAMQTVMNE